MKYDKSTVNINNHEYLWKRNSLEKLCEIVKSREIMVEVGSLVGFSTKIFAKYFDKVISIDPYLANKTGYTDQSRLDVAKDVFFLRFVDSANVTQTHLLSEQAHPYVDNQSLDMVYIDASHTYEDVKNDIAWWEPKIKPGGYMAGHDITIYDSVLNAVFEAYPKGATIIDDSWITQIN